jgi:acetyl-CoA synthetase
MMNAQNVSSAFIPPTALRMMRMVEDAPALTLKSLTSAGESLGSETYTWCKNAFGVQVDEFYGQTECNYILGSCARMGISKAGSIGKTLPGARVTLAREDNAINGEIIVHRNHPSMFLEYWNQPQATKNKFKGEWMLTGDMASRDEDKYISFIGRNDDVITSSGYRIGPVEIEDCLLQHEAIALAAVIGKRDALRTEIVKAFIVLRAGFQSNEALIKEIQEFVRSKLSSHEYPREIAFLENLPMTITGKIMRRVLRNLG